MSMEELFSAVMEHAKELLEVDRSTLFIVDSKKGVMSTKVAGERTHRHANAF